MFKFKLFKSTHHFKSNKLNKALFANIFSNKKNILPSSYTSILNIKHERDYHSTIKSYERKRSGASKIKNWNKLQTEEMMKKKKGENIYGTSNATNKKSSAISEEEDDVPLNEDDVIEIEESVKRSFNEQNVSIKDKDDGRFKFDARLTNKLGQDSKKLSKEFDNLKKHVLRAEAMIEKQQFEEALSSYEAAMNVPIDYHTGPILIGMGICYIQLNEYERAIDLFKEVINIDPNDLSCYNNLAHAYFQVDKYDESLETYKKAIDIVKDDIEYYSSDFVELNFHVGQIYLNIKEDNASAIQWFDRALLVEPDHGQILHFKAVALKNMGEQKSAKRVLLKAVENCEFPFPDSFYLLHKIFEGEGDEDTSAKYLQEYLDYQERLKKQGIDYNVY